MKRITDEVQKTAKQDKQKIAEDNKPDKQDNAAKLLKERGQQRSQITSRISKRQRKRGPQNKAKQRDS